MAMSGQLTTWPLYPLATALGAQYRGGWVVLQRRSVPLQKRTNVTAARPVAVQALFS
jgi:hypothetical protein